MTTTAILNSHLDVLFGSSCPQDDQVAMQSEHVAVLEARIEQLVRQHEAYRKDHERILAKRLEERDERIKEQRTYLQRLEREVDLRTHELREKTNRLEIANERMSRDLEAAARIQASLLPKELPELDGVRVAYAFQPCDELAGDCLNVFSFDSDRIGLYLLDVSGHGVPASLLSVTLSQLLVPSVEHSSLVTRRVDRAPGFEVVPPREIAGQLNQKFMMDEDNGQYFTAIYGTLDLPRLQFRYVSAGHPGVAYAAVDESCVIRTEPGLAIGWLEEADWDEQCLQLHLGDRFYLYSDGITEAAGANREQFGNERLTDFIDSARGLSLERSVAALVEAVTEWSGGVADDDVSVLAVEIGPAE